MVWRDFLPITLQTKIYMMIKLSREEMLAEWKRRKGMIPVSTSLLEVTRPGSHMVDDMLTAQIDDWYARLLLTQPVEMLPVRNVAEKAKVTDMGDGSVEVELPAECARVVSVKLSGWHRPARIVEEDSAVARLQSSRYVAGRSCQPVAVRCGRRLTLYSKAADRCSLTELLCVAAPADGSYELERALLDTIDNI